MDAEREELLEALGDKPLDELGDLQLVKLLSVLEDKQDELEEQLDSYEDQAEDVKDVVLDRMVENGTDKISADGKTVYIHEQDYTSVKNKQHAEAVKRLQANGMDDLIILGPQKLSSYVRQLENGLEDLPPDLQGILTTYTKRQVRVRSS